MGWFIGILLVVMIFSSFVELILKFAFWVLKWIIILTMKLFYYVKDAFND